MTKLNKVVFGIKKTDLIYLASPYTHIGSPCTEKDCSVELDRFDTVNKIAASLFEQGYMVFGPISMSAPIGKYMGQTGWDFWKKFDTKLLKMCTLLLVCDTMEGWKESVGVQAEIKIAKKNRIPVVHLSTLSETVIK